MRILYKTFIGVLMLFLSVNLYGQISVGALAGFNFGKLSGDAPDNSFYGANPGFNAGVVLDIPIGRVVKLSLQPSFSQEGTRVYYYRFGEIESFDSIQLRLNYLSVPLLVKVQSTNKHFYALAGFEAGFLMNYDLKSNGESLSNQLDIADFNLAVHFGAGYRIFLGYPVLFIELRYAQGLINLTDEPGGEGYIPRVKTTGFKAFVGIELPLTKPKKQ